MGLIRALIRLPLIFWILVIGATLYYNYMTWENESLIPLQSDVSNKKSQLARLQKQNTEAETFEKERDARFQDLQRLAEEFNQALEKLPRSSDTPGLLSNLAEISDRVGVEFTRFEPGKAVATGFLTETPFKIELKGTFVQIMSFLDEVAHLKRIVTSKSLSLKDPIIKGQNAVLKAETTLVTYYFDETAKASASSSSAPAEESTDSTKEATQKASSSSEGNSQ